MHVERVSPYLWRVPQDSRRGMRVPGLVVADAALMDAIQSDASLEQIANGATLPGIVKASMAMPDIHQGYGLPVGGVVSTDYLKITGATLKRHGISVPDRQLACAPVDSEEAADYLGAMRAAANFAFANRQVLAHTAREVFERVLGRAPRDLGMRVVYDVAHNIAKEEEHEVDGRRRRVLVHRKGATRAFPGQPVIVPGDMGRYSFVLAGTDVAMRETFGSTCHGAGRVMSRTAAVKAARGRRIESELAAR